MKQPRTPGLRRHVAFATFIAIADLMLMTGHGYAYKFRVLHSFCPPTTNCADGIDPKTGVILDGAGNLYGTVSQGIHAVNTGGSVFELQFNGSKYKFELLYRFCAARNCTGALDGVNPFGGLILDANGNLYGTTRGGGSGGSGTVFELLPNPAGGRRILETLHNFNGTDGDFPFAALSYAGAQSGAPYDGTSDLFGTTHNGGSHFNGVVYKLTFVPGQTARQETVVYEFCSQVSNGICTDGSAPAAPLIPDATGHFYGTTGLGGSTGHGTVYRISPQSEFVHSVLYNFCQLTNCSDGDEPDRGALAIDASNNILGTTASGGISGKGLVFKLPLGGGADSARYNFCAQTGCVDGSSPFAGVAISASGDLFGTTEAGGKFGGGVVFRIHGNHYTVLHSFCTQTNCTDGAFPAGGVIIDSSGDLFGTTESGGANDQGTVFELSPT